MIDQPSLKHTQLRYASILVILLALFGFRVLAQFVQAFVDLPFLPSFDAWQSGALPYWVLLVFQILIIVLYGWLLGRFRSGSVRPSRKQGWIFLALGLIYFVVMVLRLLVGLADLSEHYWFHSYLPVFFHFVLAGYLIVVGWFHWQATA